MKKIEFSNKLYLGFVLVILVYFLLVNAWALIQTGKIAALLPLTIQSIVLALVLLRHEWVKIGLKGFALFFIVGSGLTFIAQLMFLLADADDKLDYDTIVRSLIMILIGVILFSLCDRSIRPIDKGDGRISDAIKTLDD